MRKLWLILLILTAPVTVPLTYWIVAFFVLSILGFHPDAIGAELAEKLAAEGGDAQECLQIIHPLPHIMSPSDDEQRANCLYRYASLTKDPTACELLMPSSYGLSCVGAATAVKDHCSMGPTYVAWGAGKTEYSDCRYNDSGRTLRANQCCLIARVAFVKSENDCSSLSDYPELFDECLDSLAFKKGDPEVCNDIAHKNLRNACLVKAKAMREDPSICQGCKERVATLDDFQ